jgi:hypothetical protein
LCDFGALVISIIVSLFSERLMKWREPKIKGMVTPKNILAALGLILIISIPFGFLGGNGKFNIWICFLAAGFMSAAAISLIIEPLLPGTLVQLRDNMIVRGARGTNSQRSAYKDIDCVYFERDCSYSWERKKLIVNVHQKSIDGPNFTIFKVITKNDVIVDGVLQFSYSARSVHQFAVPEDVNVEQVLQILRDKEVKVVEGPLPS